MLARFPLRRFDRLEDAKARCQLEHGHIHGRSIPEEPIAGCIDLVNVAHRWR